jgi:hypothetical protein
MTVFVGGVRIKYFVILRSIATKDLKKREETKIECLHFGNAA